MIKSHLECLVDQASFRLVRNLVSLDITLEFIDVGTEVEAPLQYRGIKNQAN